jgi:hypothetical protein
MSTMINKKMTLFDARADLEKEGFKILVHDTHESLLVGLHSTCRWEISSKVDVVVVMHQLPPGQDLTLDRLNGDLAELPNAHFLEDVGADGCPPQGLSRAQMIMVAYLVPDGSIEPGALLRILAEPKKEWCRCTFLAAQDSTGSSFYMETTTPLWGRAFVPEMCYWAGRMTGRSLASLSLTSPATRFVKYFNLFALIMIVFGCFMNPLFMRSLFSTMGFYVLFLCFLFLAMFAYQWWQRRSRQHTARTRGTLLVPLSSSGKSDEDLV